MNVCREGIEGVFWINELSTLSHLTARWDSVEIFKAILSLIVLEENRFKSRLFIRRKQDETEHQPLIKNSALWKGIRDYLRGFSYTVII